jgi:DNA-3-methyladenine glycosylase I
MTKGEGYKYRTEQQPAEDSEFFEKVTQVIFKAGLNWRILDRKWGAFREAFAQFDVEKVAQFSTKDVQQLMANPEIVRNEAKIRATILNAQEFQAIKNEFGSFQRFLKQQLKDGGVEKALRILQHRFHRFGRTSSRMFLYMVGLDIPYSEK